MLPAIPPHDVSNHGLTNAVFLGQSCLCDSTLCVALPYLLHLLRTELRVVTSFAVQIAAFAHHIVSVVFMRAQKQMIGANASAHVAAMQDKKIFRYRTASQFIANAVRVLILAVDGKKAVTPVAAYASPQPATISFIHLRPEAVSHRDVAVTRDTAIRTWAVSLFQSLVYLTNTRDEGFAATIAVADFGVRMRAHFGTPNQVSGCQGVGRLQRCDLILFGPIIPRNA